MKETADEVQYIELHSTITKGLLYTLHLHQSP